MTHSSTEMEMEMEMEGRKFRHSACILPHTWVCGGIEAIEAKATLLSDLCSLFSGVP